MWFEFYNFCYYLLNGVIYLPAAIEPQENLSIFENRNCPNFFVFKTQLSVVRFMHYTDMGK